MFKRLYYIILRFVHFIMVLILYFWIRVVMSVMSGQLGIFQINQRSHENRWTRSASMLMGSRLGNLYSIIMKNKHYSEYRVKVEQKQHEPKIPSIKGYI